MWNAAARLAERAEARRLCAACVICGCVLLATIASAQSRVAIIQAEDRRAPTPADLAILRSGARADDPETRRLAVRALGRLERPALVADLVPQLRHPLPEIRADAANAIGQAAQGAKDRRNAADARAVASAFAALTARLQIEAESDVRAAICETLGRLPYAGADAIGQAERAIVDSTASSIVDRVGVAKGLESLARVGRGVRPLGPDAIAVLRRLAVPAAGDASNGSRVRRLALEALVTAAAIDDETLGAAASDADPQVRRQAMRGASPTKAPHTAAQEAALRKGLQDPSPMVRLEALRGDTGCASSIAATNDADVHVVLAALDQLGACGESAEAVATLDRVLDDLFQVGAPRAWHRAAHAIVSLAAAAPEHAAKRLPPFVISRVWQLRMYAARAAAVLGDRATLEQLAATDPDDNVREGAIDGLSKVAGHAADAVYAANVARPGYQAVRAAALALAGTPQPAAVAPALEAALQRLTREGHDNSHDARAALARALGRTASGTRTPAGSQSATQTVTAGELRRLASARARISVRGVGTFELALFTSVAPITVLKFAHLAESGYYDGLTFHRVVPNFVVQGGSPGANEYVGDAMFMRDEVSLWPHVRGAVGISTRGHDTGDAQIFVDLVDNPRLDHVYTVFAQVLNGMDVVDRILEGDVIDRVEILP